MATLTHAQLAALWIAQGGNPPEADIAAAIAQAESQGNPDAVNNTAYPSRAGYHPPAPSDQPEYSVGLWQINLLAHDYTEAAMLDPAKNAAAAVAISQNGLDFTAWSTFNNGAFNAYLPAGTTTGPIQSPATLSGAPFPNEVGLAWMRLMRTLAITAPRSLRAQAKARARLNRAVR